MRTVAREDDGIPDAISNSRARRRSLRLGGKEPAFEAAIVAIQLRPMRSAANTPLPAHRLGSEAALSPSPPAGNGSWRRFSPVGKIRHSSRGKIAVPRRPPLTLRPQRGAGRVRRAFWSRTEGNTLAKGQRPPAL